MFLEKNEKILKEQQTFKIPFLHIKYIEYIDIFKETWENWEKYAFWGVLKVNSDIMKLFLQTFSHTVVIYSCFVRLSNKIHIQADA